MVTGFESMFLKVTLIPIIKFLNPAIAFANINTPEGKFKKTSNNSIFSSPATRWPLFHKGHSWPKPRI
jgi:hypothetical protein